MPIYPSGALSRTLPAPDWYGEDAILNNHLSIVALTLLGHEITIECGRKMQRERYSKKGDARPAEAPVETYPMPTHDT